MSEKGAKRLDNLLPQASIEENDCADTLSLSDACQAGNANGDGPAFPTEMSNPAEARWELR